jgi:outer membrane murein-binding lipoprotein Lpp
MRIKALIASLCILGCFTVPAIAATTTDEQMKMDTLSSQTEALQKQVADLRHEMAALKKKQKVAKSEKSEKAEKPKKQKHLFRAQSVMPEHGRPLDPNATTVAPLNGPINQGHSLSNTDLLIQSYLQNLPLDWDNPGQSFVSIGPYVNVPIQFSGNQLIVNDPKINTDVALLKLRKAAHEGMVARGIHTEEDTHHSHLILSGILETQAQYIQYGQQGGNLGSGNNGSSSNVDLDAAELDAFLLTPSPWVSGFMSFSYDNGTDPIETNSRVLNSRVFLNNAFIILGDFTRSPFYGTVGQMYVPFGTYSSVFVSSPLTKTLARTKARAILAGYQGQEKNAFYTALYAFKGDSHASATSRINNGGINLGYKFNSPCPDINGDIGMGWIANIADSVGMQNTNNQPLFNGFAGPVPYGNEKIVHRVPALNFRGILTINDKINLIGEYVGVTTPFNPNDLSFRASSASPWAFNTEASYTFTVFDKPSSVGIGYSQAHEALAINLPEKRMGVVLNTSIWHNTIQSIEFRHDINYSASSTSTGSNVTPMSTGLGTSDNVVTVNFDLFF